jgi:general secretion pathway protein G
MLRKTCTLKADDRAAFTQSVFVFARKTAHCRVAHSMHEVACLNKLRLVSRSKDRLGCGRRIDCRRSPRANTINERQLMKIQSHQITVQKQNRNRAFTLVEILLVVTIIGILAGLVIPKLMRRGEQSRIASANIDVMGGISSALNLYEVDNGVFPKNMQDLIQQPGDARNWRGPYLGKLPIDAWGHPYIYYYPGKRNQKSFDLLSMGPDGQEGTEDDVGNW